MRKLLIILGPTAIGKTNLGIKLAKKFNGEIISADSRQVYKFMDIGTGKDILNSKFKVSSQKLQSKIRKQTSLKINIGTYKIETIPIWGLDLVKPDYKFSVAHWLKFAHKVIENIWQRKKIPIIVGGTGFWIKALIDGLHSINIPPDWKMRTQLQNLNIEQLKEKLYQLNPIRLQEMNQSDKNNPRRLIRAIEIAFHNQKSKIRYQISNLNIAKENLLMLGLRTSNQFLYQRIDKRVEKRIKQGAQQEVKNLLKMGYSWNLPSMSAIGYREWKPFFNQKINLAKVVERWKYNEHSYSRRQMIWFKKDKRIQWFNIEKKNWFKEVVKLGKSWYYKNNAKD